ncbi:hypothetical protein Pfo_023853 [Paulownia fortunei]|nr:hypothetical protein Pfo_023853 [Paulownia fortunei]
MFFVSYGRNLGYKVIEVVDFSRVCDNLEPVEDSYDWPTFNHQGDRSLEYHVVDDVFHKIQSGRIKARLEAAGLKLDDSKFPYHSSRWEYDHGKVVVSDKLAHNRHDYLSGFKTGGVFGLDFGELLKYSHEMVNVAKMNYGEASKGDHGSNADEIWIDMGKVDYVSDHAHQVIAFQKWKEYMDQLKKSKFNDNPIAMFGETTLALSGQAVGAVMANAITSSTDFSFSWDVYVVVCVTLTAMSFTLAGISLRGKKRALSILMTKIGSTATAFAIIFSLGLHLPPVMAWTVGTVAFFIMAVAVALA